MSETNQKPLGTRAALDRYDAAKRAEATKARRPIVRMSQRSMPVRVTSGTLQQSAHFLFQHRGVTMMQKHGKAPIEVTGKDLVAATLKVGGILIATNGKTLRDCLALLRSVDTSSLTDTQAADVRTAHRMLSFAKTAVVSSKFAALTDVLSRKFYLPERYDPAKLSDWLKAFGLTVDKSDPYGVLMKLLSDCCTDSAAIDVIKKNNPWVTITDAEAMAEKSAEWGGPGPAATQFDASGAISNGWDAVCHIDPILRHRCELTGDVVRIRPVRLEQGGFACRTYGPVRIKEGDVIVTPCDHETNSMAFVSVKKFLVTEDDQMEVLLVSSKSQSSRSGRDGMTSVFNALHDNEDLLISAAPFLALPSTVVAKRWSGKQMAPEDQVTRDVPLYVSLAGA